MQRALLEAAKSTDCVEMKVVFIALLDLLTFFCTSIRLQGHIQVHVWRKAIGALWMTIQIDDCIN